jgi:hypothetical protein
LHDGRRCLIRVFDTADNDDGDDAEEKSVDDRDDTVEGVETNGDVSGNNEPTAADTILVFFGVVDANLPTVAFLRGGGFGLRHGCDE